MQQHLESAARILEPCAAAPGPKGPMLPSVAAIPNPSGGLLQRGHTSVLSDHRVMESTTWPGKV